MTDKSTAYNNKVVMFNNQRRGGRRIARWKDRRITVRLNQPKDNKNEIFLNYSRYPGFLRRFEGQGAPKGKHSIVGFWAMLSF
jgi:hypothetical protein